MIYDRPYPLLRLLQLERWVKRAMSGRRRGCHLVRPMAPLPDRWRAYALQLRRQLRCCSKDDAFYLSMLVQAVEDRQLAWAGELYGYLPVVVTAGAPPPAPDATAAGARPGPDHATALTLSGLISRWPPRRR